MAIKSEQIKQLEWWVKYSKYLWKDVAQTALIELEIGLKNHKSRKHIGDRIMESAGTYSCGEPACLEFLRNYARAIYAGENI